MSFGDFNRDGHTSLPEAIYAYGMLEDSDDDARDYGTNEGVGATDIGCLVALGLWLLLIIVVGIASILAGLFL